MSPSDITDDQSAVTVFIASVLNIMFNVYSRSKKDDQSVDFSRFILRSSSLTDIYCSRFVVVSNETVWSRFVVVTSMTICSKSVTT